MGRHQEAIKKPLLERFRFQSFFFFFALICKTGGLINFPTFYCCTLVCFFVCNAFLVDAIIICSVSISSLVMARISNKIASPRRDFFGGIF